VTTIQKFRTDIQGMRAVAVLLVLLFHVFPGAMPGGYIGVDIFFVISGFLICGIILKNTERDGKFDALKFYAKRIRRLLPAATLVLILTAVAAYFILPQTRWVDTGREIIASTLYFENLYLHFQSIDYLTADKPPSPLQHFWSLSVEEQFYIFWPLIMLLMVFVARSLRMTLRVSIITLLVIIFAISLASSIYVTATNPAAAYFVTYTRVWELALGGALACAAPFIRLPEKLRTPVAALGLLMVLGSGILFTENTPFPGSMALIPTVGVGFLLWAGILYESDKNGAVQKALSFRPLTYIGDISYSLYLWHWPVVIFAIALFGPEISISAGLAVIILSVLGAALSTHFLENPIRHTDKLKSKLELYLLGAFSMAIAVIAGLLLMLAAPKEEVFTAGGEETEQFQSDYPGAAAIGTDASDLPVVTPAFIPSLANARKDVATVYADQCHTAQPDTAPLACIYNPVKGEDGRPVMEKQDELSEASDKTVVLVGDSHAAQWLPALKKIAAKRNWTIVTYTKSSCAFNKAMLMWSQKPYEECQAWGQLVVEEIKTLKPDLVITGQYPKYAEGAETWEDNVEKVAAGAASYWNAFGEEGIRVAALNESPRFETHIPDCIAENLPDWSACNITREAAFSRGGTMLRASELSPNTSFIDMTDSICGEEICSVIIGNVLVYRDQHHLTATYVRTLAPELEKALLSAIET
jgi:peptidoglycan/LPS O-acetylase OafA/YrhL